VLRIAGTIAILACRTATGQTAPHLHNSYRRLLTVGWVLPAARGTRCFDSVTPFPISFDTRRLVARYFGSIFYIITVFEFHTAVTRGGFLLLTRGGLFTQIQNSVWCAAGWRRWWRVLAWAAANTPTRA